MRSDKLDCVTCDLQRKNSDGVETFERHVLEEKVDVCRGQIEVHHFDDIQMHNRLRRIGNL
jgi:hypothetical protein